MARRPWADIIRDKGGEYGTTTGRPRRIGWLDTVALRHSIQINGFDWLALMLLDVLSGLDTVVENLRARIRARG